MSEYSRVLLYLFTGLVFVVGGAWISGAVVNRDDAEDVVDRVIQSPIARPLVECPPNFLSYSSISQNSDRVVKLIDSRKKMFAADGKFVNSKIVITKNDTNESKVACGYLFVRVGTTKNGSLQSWENIYINPNDFGGHINPANQLGPGDGRNFSEYLFPLNKIQYWKTRADRAKDIALNADWAALLNVSETVSFEIALNTNDRTGFIDDISIAYKCWNPATGEENSGCKLKVINNEDTETDTLVQ